MKKHLILVSLLASFIGSAPAATINLDAGELTSPGSAPMQVDNNFPSNGGSLLLLIDLGSSNTIDNTLSPGSFVSGTNFIVGAAGFNTTVGTNETLSVFNTIGGTVGDDLALRWFPQLTYAQYKSGSLTIGGDYFGTYAPSPLGSAPDGGFDWTLPSSSSTINLNFYTTNSDGGGTQTPEEGFTNFQVESPESVPEPSGVALLGFGSLVLFWLARKKIIFLA